jgi:vancomycin aglycone glucosyltransferase
MSIKVLIAVEGSEGDNRPVLAVAMKLKERGIRVLACVPKDYVDYWTSYGVPAFPMGVTTREFFLGNARSLYDRFLGMPRTFIRLYPAYVKRQFDSLREHVRGVDVILSSGFVFAAGSIAETAGIPMIHAVFSPVYLRSPSVPPPNVPLLHLPGAANSALWSCLGVALDTFALPRLQKMRKALGLPALRNLSDHLMKHLVLSMEAEIAPLPKGWTGQGTSQTAYPRLPDGRELPPHVEKFLGKGHPTVYIGFGSMLDPDCGRTLRIVRKALRLADCRALVCQGWTTLKDAPRETDRVLFVGHLPHSKIFPRVAAVVHHGGAGTLYSAVRAGVPQSMVPHFLDQYFHAETARRLGIGPAGIRWRTLTAHSLAEALRGCMTAESYRRNARRLAERLACRDGASELADLVISRALGR